MPPEESGGFLFLGKKKRRPVRGGGPTMLISLESIYRASVMETLSGIVGLKESSSNSCGAISSNSPHSVCEYRCSQQLLGDRHLHYGTVARQRGGHVDMKAHHSALGGQGAGQLVDLGKINKLVTCGGTDSSLNPLGPRIV